MSVRRMSLATALLAVMMGSSGAAMLAQTMVTAARPTGKQAAVAKVRAAKVGAANPTAELLPEDFAGWRRDGAARVLNTAQQADTAQAAALGEYGFKDGATATYARGAEKLTVRALRFGDATGAYGAYTFYRKSGWPKEEIGAGAASDHNRILFWQGETLVDATVSRVTAMTGSDLRELAADLPKPQTDKSLAPPVVADLPNVAGDGPLEGQTTHYALGVAGYAGSGYAASGDAGSGDAGSGGVLPPDMVGFDRGAEAVTAEYRLRSGPATLTLINYPTPQMAAAQERKIAAYLQAGKNAQQTAQSAPWTTALVNSTPGSVLVKRSGPLVAVVSGDAVPDDARRLIGLVHYEADVSALPGGGPTEIQKTAKLLLGILMLVAVMFVAALTAAVFLGGGRALVRLAMGKPASTLFDEEFTRLDLH